MNGQSMLFINAGFLNIQQLMFNNQFLLVCVLLLNIGYVLLNIECF